MERLSDNADFYELLGVTRSATEQDINKGRCARDFVVASIAAPPFFAAASRSSRSNHPDKNPGEKEPPRRLSKRLGHHAVLSNKEKPPAGY